MAKSPKSATPPPDSAAAPTPPRPVSAGQQTAKFFAVARMDSGGYHVLEAELALDDPRVKLATISRLPRTQAYEAFMLKTKREILSPTLIRPPGGGGNA
jgi:hypothetical protein